MTLPRKGWSLAIGEDLLLGGLLGLPGGDAQGAGDVAGDVQAGTAHVEQTVNTVDDHDSN